MTNVEDSPEGLPSKNKFRLIVHIGAGKTGTTSIQQTLLSNRKQLAEQGFLYLGLMLEHAPVKLYSWQKDSAIEELMKLDENDITNQILDVMRASVDEISKSGFKSAIWSNESFFDRPKAHTAVIKAIQTLSRETGWQIDIITYLRRHDAWARSAYIQWGIKHKTYVGPLISFSSWISRNPPSFLKNIKKWMEESEFNFILRNVDALNDVVEDFFACFHISLEGITTRRFNESPSTEELLLRALFNNQIEEKVLPFEFDRVLPIKKTSYNFSANTFLDRYLPTHDDLQALISSTTEEREEINKLLVSYGQKPFEETPLKSKTSEVDLGKITSILFDMLVMQAKKIENLELKLQEITNKSGN